MRFSFPDLSTMNSLYYLARKLYKERFYDFVGTIKQNIFYIHNGDINVVVVVDSTLRKMDLFYGDEGLMTCHNLFAGDRKGILNYGFCSLSIEEVDTKDVTYSGLELAMKKFHHYHYEGKTVCYISTRPGQNECVINAKEALLMIDVLRYLFHIKKAYNNQEVETVTQEECVAVFEFNDEEYTYSCNFVALNNFDFIPNVNLVKRKDSVFFNYVKDLEVMPGNLYLGQFYVNSLFEEYECSNKVQLSLQPTTVYAASDTGIFEVETYAALGVEQAKALKEEVLAILLKVGLFDTIITDNYRVYSVLVSNLKGLDINIRYDSRNFVSNFLYKTISATLQLDNSVETITSILDEMKENYASLLPDMEAFDNDIDPFDDFEVEEVDEDDDIDSTIVS